MTLGELRKTLEQIGTGHDHREIEVWLPGSRILLKGNLFNFSAASGEALLIEGNVKEGSVLEVLARAR